MLRNFAIAGAPAVALPGGLTVLKREQALAPVASGWALFDLPSHLLPGAGQVEVEIAASLDGRRYLVRRALDVPEHWQVTDVETGWLAASGPADVTHWLCQNLGLVEDTPLPALFTGIVSFSLPVTVAWLLDEPGLRERRAAALLRTERYRSGLRWLDEVAAGAAGQVQALQSEVRALEGRDALFDGIRRGYDAARAGSLAAADAAGKLRLALSEAEAAELRLAAVDAELEELRGEMQARRLALAALEAQTERWQHWQAVHDRAAKAMEEHQPDWQAYQDTLVAISANASQIAGIEPLRLELRGETANVLALQREQELLERQLAAIHAAETAAADLAEAVHQQQQVEQQVGLAQERAIRLDLVNRALQQTLQESKRVEVLQAELDRQLAEAEQLAPQAARVKALQAELEDQQQQAREAAKRVDHLRFLETAARAIGGHLDELRKGSSITERLAVKAGVGASEVSAADERTMTGHLREAIDHQVNALERQLRDWQGQSRELAGEPMRQNQLRATIHQLEQELAAARQVELKLGAIPALRQHRKNLLEHLDQLKKTTEAQLKEQRECSDAPLRLGALRHDLQALKDPRSERQALLRTAARKDAAENELKQVQRSRAEAEQRRKTLDARLAEMAEVQDQQAELGRRRDDLHEGYCTFLAQQAIAELASGAAAELSAVTANVGAQRRLQEQSEVRETALLASRGPLEDAPLRVSALRAEVDHAERRAAEWNDRYQAAADEYAAAEDNRRALAKQRAELEKHARAGAMLAAARARVAQAEQILGQQVRDDVSAAAARWLDALLDDPTAGLAWKWGEAPVLVRGGASHPIDELGPELQASCALALRLAIAADASGFGTVFVSGLGPLLESEETALRLQALAKPAQLLVPSAW